MMPLNPHRQQLVYGLSSDMYGVLLCIGTTRAGGHNSLRPHLILNHFQYVNKCKHRSLYETNLQMKYKNHIRQTTESVAQY